MTYERTGQIEQRFGHAIAVIESGSADARRLADALRVSRPTAHRIVAELRRRGFVIRSVHDEQGWRYELVSRPDSPSRAGSAA